MEEGTRNEREREREGKKKELSWEREERWKKGGCRFRDK